MFVHAGSAASEIPLPASPGIALFDFDGTLCPGDSILPYLLFCVSRGCAPLSQLPRAGRAWLRHRTSPADLSRVKETTLSFLTGRSVADMDALARDFIRKKLLPRVRPDGLALLERLRGEGWTPLIVSASPDCYMRLLPEVLPVEDVISTRCETAGGLYTGHVGENCRGEEKTRRVKEWMAANGRSDEEAILACGDSDSDGPMLRMAGTRLLVTPSRGLRAEFRDAPVCRW